MELDDYNCVLCSNGQEEISFNCSLSAFQSVLLEHGCYYLEPEFASSGYGH